MRNSLKQKTTTKQTNGGKNICAHMHALWLSVLFVMNLRGQTHQAQTNLPTSQLHAPTTVALFACKHRTFPLPFCLLSFGMTGTEKIYPLGITQYFLVGWMGWVEVRVRILLWPMYWTQNSRVISHNSVPFRLISHNSVTFRDEFQHFHDFWTIPNTSYHNYEALVT